MLSYEKYKISVRILIMYVNNKKNSVRNHSTNINKN